MMRLESGYISLERVHFRAFHGVMEQEGRVGGDFRLTLRVGYPLWAACESDEVGDTLDYAALFRVVSAEMAVPSKLLEHVAWRMAKAVERTFPQVTSVDLWLTKENPPMGADCKGATVEIHLINDKTE